MILKVFLSVVIIVMADGKVAISSREIIADRYSECQADSQTRAEKLVELPSVKEAYPFCLSIHNTRGI